MKRLKVVSYIRVSTEVQGRSGLGMAAQQAEIDSYVKANSAQLVSAYVEVESGGRNNRPELQAALKHAKLTGSRLAIAKLDRLSRNAAFLLNLQDAGVDFVACDNAGATPLTIGVLALVAQEEAKAISARTKAALAACKVRGTKLGNPNGAAALRKANKGNTATCARQREDANARAIELQEILTDITDRGFPTLTSQADELNRLGIKTARGGKWHASTVRNVKSRMRNLRTQ